MTLQQSVLKFLCQKPSAGSQNLPVTPNSPLSSSQHDEFLIPPCPLPNSVSRLSVTRATSAATGFRLLALGTVLISQLLIAQSPRLESIQAMLLRPDDPWPRGKGHVVLAVPGCSEASKGYHEPGGSFSPGFGSFGVSVWITGIDGRIQATSDSIPLDDIRQQLVWQQKRELPSIQTETPYYHALWSFVGEGRWRLDLSVHINAGMKAFVVVRSVGPAGGPVRILDWHDQQLRIDQRWSLRLIPNPAAVSLGDESVENWKVSGSGLNRYTSAEGWGFARFELRGANDWTFTIRDNIFPPATPLTYSSTLAGLQLNLPDSRFTNTLHAQVAHLMMGLVNNETRPGDPNNYPLNWLRDGAYSIVALARAGQLDVAKQLCRPFAERDFFGGFGSEADGPGLALWALDEVAARLHDPGFDSWLWPHVQRKARLIQEMLSAKEPLHKPFSGAIIPAHTNRDDLDLVCDAAKDGLIVGRMDWHRPILFVNAVSYRGLLCAAQLAGRVGKDADAQLWRDRAGELKQAWAKSLASAEADNERACISGLHPTWVVSDKGAFEKKLAEHRARTHDPEDRLRGKPLWTYFNMAEAHQWLMLGHPDKAWNDLRWFWDNQASPGLFTWWEGQGEENTFHRWEQARGWVAPPHVTPHYWTAAEVLLLQLDMLACLDESGNEPTLVIGAGIPKEWLDVTMSVKGLSTRLGKVDWEWRKGEMSVRMRGEKCAVRLGPAFPPDAKVKN
jgi:hypothetical protein